MKRLRNDFRACLGMPEWEVIRMRELKFRAWDKRNNKWFHQDLFYVSNAGFYSDFRELDDGNSLFDYEYELMQYTGL